MTDLTWFDPKKLTTFILMIYMTSVYSNIICYMTNPNLFDPFWTDLIWSEPKKLTMFILIINVTTLYNDLFLYVINSNLIKFDPFWTDLIQSDQEKNYRNYYQGQVNCLKRLKICKIWKSGKFGKRLLILKNWNPSLIKYDPIWTDLIEYDHYQTTIFIIKGK